MKIAIIMPAYNEEKRIEKTLKEYVGFFKGIESVEIIVVLNACKDKTKEIVEKVQKNNREIVYLEYKRGGKGFAVREGFNFALKGNFDLIGFVDADMATKPEDFYKLIKNIGNYDAIIASRYLKESIVNPKPTIQRMVASRAYNFFIRSLFLLNYRDTQCGAKVFKPVPLKRILLNLAMSQLAFDLDIIYNLKKAGYRIKEFPTVWSDKEYSTINFMGSGPMMGLAIIRLRLLNSPFKGVVKFYDKLIRFLRREQNH